MDIEGGADLKYPEAKGGFGSFSTTNANPALSDRLPLEVGYVN